MEKFRQEQAKRFGRSIQVLRRRQGLTQEKLAEKAGISTDYVQAIERGTRLPNVAIAEELRKALGARWEELVVPE